MREGIKRRVTPYGTVYFEGEEYYVDRKYAGRDVLIIKDDGILFASVDSEKIKLKGTEHLYRTFGDYNPSLELLKEKTDKLRKEFPTMTKHERGEAVKKISEECNVSKEKVFRVLFHSHVNYKIPGNYKGNAKRLNRIKNEYLKKRQYGFIGSIWKVIRGYRIEKPIPTSKIVQDSKKLIPSPPRSQLNRWLKKYGLSNES